MKTKTSSKRHISHTKNKRSDEFEDKPNLKLTINHHCKLCGAGFAQMNNFTKHLLTHNEHETYKYMFQKVY